MSQVTGASIKASLQFAISPSTCVVVGSLCHYWTVLSQMKLSLPFLVLNQARGLWHSFGLFLAVSLPWLYWLNVMLRQLRM